MFSTATWVRLGELDISTDNDTSKPEDFRIIQSIPHPKYSRTSVYHDIALFKLDRKVTFNEFIRPICLHTAYTLPNYNNNTAVITGWGMTEIGLLFFNCYNFFLLQISHNHICSKGEVTLYSLDFLSTSSGSEILKLIYFDSAPPHPSLFANCEELIDIF